MVHEKMSKIVCIGPPVFHWSGEKSQDFTVVVLHMNSKFHVIFRTVQSLDEIVVCGVVACNHVCTLSHASPRGGCAESLMINICESESEHLIQRSLLALLHHADELYGRK